MKGSIIASRYAKAGKTLLANPGEFRFAPKWFLSLLPGHGPMADHRPWMNFRVIEWLESYLKPDMRVFEYGSGGSTLFLAERVAQVVSVEHDEGFFEFLAKQLQQEGVSNCTYTASVPQPMRSGEIPRYGCTSFTSDWPALRTMRFENYVKTIDDYPDKSFDLVTVDGRARPSCALRALPKIKDGGWLLVDNMERSRYAIIRDLLAQHECLDFFGVVPYEVRPQRTTVWRIAAH
ncbi:MAG: methyltransferase domain-containing protein [Thiobacillus sp.]